MEDSRFSRSAVMPGRNTPARHSGPDAITLLTLVFLLSATLVLGPPVNTAAAAVAGEFPIAETSDTQKVPGIGGNVAVWEDDRNNLSNIVGKNLATGEEFTVTTGTDEKGKPVTNGELVVWEDKRLGDWDILGYDIAAGDLFRITPISGDQRNPAIHGDKVVWQDNRAGADRWEIYSFDLGSRQESPVATGPGFKTNASLDERFVVWQDDRDGGSNIYAKDLQTDEEFPVTTDGGSMHPAISAGRVVWQSPDSNSYDIFGQDLYTGEEFRVTDEASDQTAPAINGKIVTWQDGRDGNPDVFGQDLETGGEFPVATGSRPQESPALDGKTVIWEAQRDGETNFGVYDIFGAELDTAPAAPRGVEAAGSLDGVDLKWRANPEADLAGYNVYRSDSAEGDYAKLNATPLSESSYSDAEAPKGAKSYYRITAVDDTDRESGASTASSATHTLSDVSLNADPATLEFGQSTNLSGQLTSDGEPVANQEVSLIRRTLSENSFSPVEGGPFTTDAQGNFSIEGLQPEKNTIYRAVFGGNDSGRQPSASAPVRVNVSADILLNIGKDEIVAGQRVAMGGVVRPNKAGSPVEIVIRQAGQIIDRESITLDENSIYKHIFRAQRPGNYVVRAIVRGDQDNLGKISDVEKFRATRQTRQ